MKLRAGRLALAAAAMAAAPAFANPVLMSAKTCAK
jgi:hypothetical protein